MRFNDGYVTVAYFLWPPCRLEPGARTNKLFLLLIDAAICVVYRWNRSCFSTNVTNGNEALMGCNHAIETVTTVKYENLKKKQSFRNISIGEILHIHSSWRLVCLLYSIHVVNDDVILLKRTCLTRWWIHLMYRQNSVTVNPTIWAYSPTFTFSSVNVVNLDSWLHPVRRPQFGSNAQLRNCWWGYMNYSKTSKSFIQQLMNIFRPISTTII